MKIALLLFVALISVLFRYLYLQRKPRSPIRSRLFINYETYKTKLFFQLIRNTSSVNYIATAYIFNWGTKYVYQSSKWPYCEKPHSRKNMNFKPYWYFHHIFNFRLENKETSEPRANCCTIIKSF